MIGQLTCRCYRMMMIDPEDDDIDIADTFSCIIVLPRDDVLPKYNERYVVRSSGWWVWQPRVELVVDGVLYPHVHSVMLQSASSLRFCRCGLGARFFILRFILESGQTMDYS